MSIEAMVLGAMLRLARRRKAADPSAVALRVRATEAEVRAALRRLDRRGLVERRLSHPPRLTMEGFAVAVALLPRHPARMALAPAARARQGGVVSPSHLVGGERQDACDLRLAAG
jgi:hypothetical protein